MRKEGSGDSYQAMTVTGDTYSTVLDDGDSDDSVTVQLSSDLSDFSVGDEITITVEQPSNGDDALFGDYAGVKWEVQIIHTPSDSLLVDTTVTSN